MIRITDRSQCCGCTACQAVCPHEAIDMKADAMGFRYPQVDEALCVGCGLCENVCDFSNRRKKDCPSDRIEVYAARHKDHDVVSGSQSGGVFTAVSDVVLNSGGVVYGAILDSGFNVVHGRALTHGERDKMRGSKYSQSRMDGIFRSVLTDLKEGRRVMFSGTPCQIAGLHKFIPEKYHERLILVDIVCHGVPSPAVWEAYVNEMKRKGMLSSVSFRDKGEGGWKEHVESFVFADGRKLVRETFRVLFYKNIMLRPGCGNCTYDIFNRCSDVVIADFWGIGDICSEYDGDMGTSMVMPLTEKGRKIIGEASSSLDSCRIDVDMPVIARRNPNLLASTSRHPESDSFEKAFTGRGFRYVAKRWGDMGWRYKVWQLKCLIRKMKLKR